jgi:hypothetical protein
MTIFLRQIEKSIGQIFSLEILLFFLIIFPSDIFAQSYLWPTNSSEYLSASFCEFREGHYHSAIDIKTWNTEGYPCYAVEDGYIKTIRVSPFGYGKVIYLQLKDGNTAVYAHLQKFSDQVETQIRTMQFENKKYSVTWWPTNLKIKKGDIIATTGRTGIGVPHLHFEIRNKNGNPLNPLQFYSQVKDHIRPLLQEISVIPLTTGTKINGSYLPQRFLLTHIKDGVYICKKPIYIEGLIGLAIRGYDQADEVHNKYGFYKSILEIAGKKKFELVYNELEFETTQHIYTEIYYRWWAELKDRFNKLFLESFNPLPFYNRTLDSDGSIEVFDKPVSFKIIVSDFFSNQSIITGELLNAETTSIQIRYAQKQGKWVYVDFDGPPITDLSFYLRDQEMNWKSAKYFEIMEGQIHNPDQIHKVKIALDDSTDQKLKISINNKIEKVITLGATDLQGNISHKIHTMGKTMIVQIPDIDFRPFLRLEPQNIPLDFIHVPESGIEILIPSSAISGIKSVLTILSDNEEFSLPVMDYQQLLPDKNHSVSWFDSALVISTLRGSIMDTVMITASRLAADTISGAYPLASQIYQVGPENFPIFQSLRIQIKTDSLPGWGKWSLYKINGKDRLSFLPSIIDSLRLELSARISSLGKFMVISDTIAPQIFIKSPQTGKVYKKTPDIHLDIKDQISGIGDEENISMLMDGEFVLPEWDPEEDILMGLLRDNLDSGDHLFEVTVRDRVGNIVRKSINFKIQ